MNRHAFAIAALSVFWALPAPAILDQNGNNLSDLWEMEYNNGTLPVPKWVAAADYDADGWTNEVEAAAGTNPFHGNPPDGFLRPDVAHIPEVLVDLDSDGDPETVQSPESITIAWPTIAGKQYTLMVSSDLVEWLPLPGETFIGTENPMEPYAIPLPEDEKLFWRVKVEDVDSDGDGLTNAEEAELGLNPDNSQTIPGLDDYWLATNFTPELQSGGPSAVDPSADPDSDDLTTEQEYIFGSNPKIAENHEDIGNESIVNGELSSPPIFVPDGDGNGTTGLEATKGKTGWNYWAGINGWSAVLGQNVELQNLWSESAGDQYIELNAHPDDLHPGTHRGVQQWIKTRKGVQYVLLFRCALRPDVDAALSNFDVYADETRINQITFTTPSDPETVTWEAHSAVFTAQSVLTRLSFKVPDDHPNDTTGGFLDDVMLAPVAIEDNSFATGVDAVSITAAQDDNGYCDKFWVMAPSGNDINGNPCSNAMKFNIPFVPSMEMQINPPVAPNPTATPDPATLTLSNAAPCSWHGGVNISSDINIVWKLGLAGPPAGTKDGAELPIGVKVMKHRTVKVRIYLVNLLKSDGEVQEINQYMLPTEESIGTHLYNVFSKQINAWFQVSFEKNSDGTLRYYQVNPGTDGLFSFLGSDETSPDQQSVLNLTGNPANVDIRIFIIANEGSFLVQNEELAKGFTNRSAATCWILGRSTGNYNGTNDVESTMAHEIGHVLVGYNHPDLEGGPAHLAGTDRSLRLMCSLPNRSLENGKLLVKKEWDEADVWLQERPNGDN